MTVHDMSAFAARLTSVESTQREFREDLAEAHREIDTLGEAQTFTARQVAVHEEQISGGTGLVKAMETLGGKVDGLNRTLWAFAGSFMVSAITIAVAIVVNGH
jgi:hypothetical protein